MVVQRTLDKIEELKERPHHERRAIAKAWAIGVAAFILLVWGFFSVRSIGHVAMQLHQPQLPGQQQTTAGNGSNQAASAAAAQQSASASAPQQLKVASSTNGRVQLAPAGQ